MALAVVKPDGLDMGIAAQRPGETGRGILAAREQNKGPIGMKRLCHSSIMAVIVRPVTRPDAYARDTSPLREELF
jgi:hypothetical protein